VSNTAPAFRAMFLFRGFGSGVGISILSLIVQLSLSKRLHRLGLSDEEARRIRESLDNIPKDGMEALVRRAYGLAIADSFVWVLVVFVLCVVPVIMIKGKSLVRKE
jgi:heme exporter protein D